MAVLALWLGTPAAALADDGAWGASPAAQLGRPVIAQSAPADPAVRLDRPRPVGAAPAADPLFRPASYEPVFRGQIPDAKPMPSGVPAGADAPVVSRNWQRVAPDQVAPAPAVVGAPVVGGAPVGCGEGNCCDGGCCDGGCGCGWHWPVWTFLHDHLCGCQAGCADACCGGGCDGNLGDCGCGCPGGGGCGCGCGTGGPDDPLRNHLYVSAEYLLWQTKGDAVPPLITAGSAGDLAAGLRAGSIGLPGTATLFGGSDYNTGERSGGRFMAGWWFGDDHCIGVEGGGFFLSSKSRGASFTSSGTPILTRPFFDTTLGGAPNAEFVSLVTSGGTPVLGGTVSASIRSSFWGAEANLRSNLWCGPRWDVDGLVGYRHLQLDENLKVSESLTGLGPAAGFTFASNDNFRVRNSFNGVNLGIDAERRFGRWFFDLKTKVALGDNSERADISGSTTSATGGAITFVGNGGLLTADRTGGYHQSRFAVAPEVDANIGYNVTDHMRVFIGYDFLYLSNVIRAGDQVNLNVNPNRFIGAGGPANTGFTFRTSDYWAQGVNFGLEFRW